jgi:hypothetical protein
VFSAKTQPALVFCGEIQSTLAVLRQDSTILGVLGWVTTGYRCYPARSNYLLQSTSEFLIGIEIFGEFLFGVGVLWYFSLIMFGLVRFLVFYKTIVCAPSYSSLRRSIRRVIRVCKYFGQCYDSQTYIIE